MLLFFNYGKSTFALPFRVGCHVNRLLGWKPTIAAWLFVCHLKRCLGDSIQSCFDTSRLTSIQIWFDTHLKSIRCMQTEVTIRNKTLRYLAVWNHHRIPFLELTSDTGRFVPLWGLSDFLWNRAGFSEEVYGIQLAEKVLRIPDKHDFSLSGMMVFWLIAIICDANIKRLLLGYLVLLWSDVSLYQIDFSLCWIDFRCVLK